MTRAAHTTLRTAIQSKYEKLTPYLNERTRRLWAATEAGSLGHGGVRVVAEATQLSRTTIHAGIHELAAPEESAAADRIRRTGGGRKRSEENDAGLVTAL